VSRSWNGQELQLRSIEVLGRGHCRLGRKIEKVSSLRASVGEAAERITSTNNEKQQDDTVSSRFAREVPDVVSARTRGHVSRRLPAAGGYDERPVD